MDNLSRVRIKYPSNCEVFDRVTETEYPINTLDLKSPGSTVGIFLKFKHTWFTECFCEWLDQIDLGPSKLPILVGINIRIYTIGSTLVRPGEQFCKY